MKKIIVSLLVPGLLFASGCFGTGELADGTREFFEMVADGQYEDAYAYTSVYVRESYTYEDFLFLIDDTALYEYDDFNTSGFDYSSENGFTEEILYGEWCDIYGYCYNMEVYWIQINDEWQFDGFYFTE